MIAKEKDDMVAAVQANLLFQSLNMTREELLLKYPIPLNNKEESLDEGQLSEGNLTVEPMQPFMQHQFTECGMQMQQNHMQSPSQ